jgi:hypothetical protein
VAGSRIRTWVVEADGFTDPCRICPDLRRCGRLLSFATHSPDDRTLTEPGQDRGWARFPESRYQRYPMPAPKATPGRSAPCSAPPARQPASATAPLPGNPATATARDAAATGRPPAGQPNLPFTTHAHLQAADAVNPAAPADRPAAALSTRRREASRPPPRYAQTCTYRRIFQLWECRKRSDCPVRCGWPRGMHRGRSYAAVNLRVKSPAGRRSMKIA